MCQVIVQKTLTHFTTLARTIDYTYDDRYHLTAADYTSGEQYSYTYDPVGNRLEQIIGGDTTSYTYDAANRLATVNGTSYTFDANGNLLTTGTLTNTWDAANRLITAAGSRQPLAVSYDGLGNRVAQTVGVTTTYYALDTAIGLPEVLYTSEGNTYLHLPSVIMTENATGEVRYLLSDGLGSVRHAIDENATVIAYKEFDPYGSPLPTAYSLLPTPFGYTGEWWEDDVGLLYLRARWYQPETGTFLSRDAVESEPPYQYVRGNPFNLTDPSGFQASDPTDPKDPGWCENWSRPYILSCYIITNPWTPEGTFLKEIYHVYKILQLGTKIRGQHVNALFLSYFLDPAKTELNDSDPKWGTWLRTDSNFNRWHEAQLSSFIRSNVMRKALENCETNAGPWKVRGLPTVTNGSPTEFPYPVAELSEEGARFSLIPISSFASEVGITLGKYWLQGDFYAENIQKEGDEIRADIKIERFVDDIFDFAGDFGGVPVHNMIPSGYPNPGIGDVPNVWAQTLHEKNWASYFDIHLEWTEEIKGTWKK